MVVCINKYKREPVREIMRKDFFFFLIRKIMLALILVLETGNNERERWNINIYIWLK